MSIENNNFMSEKNSESNYNNLKEKNELTEIMSPNIEDQPFPLLYQSKNISCEEIGEKSEKEDKLKLYSSFEISALYQILINKLMPPGYKLETEEILLKTDVPSVETALTSPVWMENELYLESSSQ